MESYDISIVEEQNGKLVALKITGIDESARINMLKAALMNNGLTLNDGIAVFSVGDTHIPIVLGNELSKRFNENVLKRSPRIEGFRGENGQDYICIMSENANFSSRDDASFRRMRVLKAGGNIL